MREHSLVLISSKFHAFCYDLIIVTESKFIDKSISRWKYWNYTVICAIKFEEDGLVLRMSFSIIDYDY